MRSSDPFSQLCGISSDAHLNLFILSVFFPVILQFLCIRYDFALQFFLGTIYFCYKLNVAFEPYTFSLIFFILYRGGDAVVNYYLSLKLYKHEWKMGEDPGSCPLCWLSLMFFLERAASLPYSRFAADRLRGLHPGFLYWLKLCLRDCPCLWSLRALRPGCSKAFYPPGLWHWERGFVDVHLRWKPPSLPVSSLVSQKLLFLLQAEPFSEMSPNTILCPLPTQMIQPSNWKFVLLRVWAPVIKWQLHFFWESHVRVGIRYIVIWVNDSATLFFMCILKGYQL